MCIAGIIQVKVGGSPGRFGVAKSEWGGFRVQVYRENKAFEEKSGITTSSSSANARWCAAPSQACHRALTALCFLLTPNKYWLICHMSLCLSPSLAAHTSACSQHSHGCPEAKSITAEVL